MTEERMIELARKLGARAAEQLDVEATARNVVARLREQPVRRTVWVQQTWLRIAAALVIVVGSAVAVRQILPVRTQSHAAHLIADDLDDLSADELRDVLGSFDELMTTDSIAVPEDSTDLRALDAQQLRSVLRALEGEG